MMNTLGCLVLAGGESKRFGGNKALYSFKGRTFLERAIDAALKISDDIIVSVREEKNIGEYSDVLRDKLKNKKGINFIPDDGRCRFKGPLRGIFSCFKFFKGAFVQVIECDAPYFNSSCAKIISDRLTNDMSGVVPMWPDSTVEPLLACYKRAETIDILNRLHGYAAKNNLIFNDALTLSRLFRTVLFYNIGEIIKTYPDIKPEFFMNINDKKSLDFFSAGSKNYNIYSLHININSFSDRGFPDMTGSTASIKIKRRNVFTLTDSSGGIDKKPYGWTAGGLYYMELYKKTGENIYLKKALYFFKEEADFYHKKGLVFMASKIKGMLSSIL